VSKNKNKNKQKQRDFGYLCGYDVKRFYVEFGVDLPSFMLCCDFRPLPTCCVSFGFLCRVGNLQKNYSAASNLCKCHNWR